MAEVSKKQQEIIKKMQEAQAKRAKVAKKTGQLPRGEKSMPQSSTEPEKAQTKKATPRPKKTLSEKQLEAQVKSLKAQLVEKDNQARKSSESKQYEKEQEALNSIIRNNDDYHFAKKYTIHGPHDKTKKIAVKMHAPSVSEQAEIQQEFVRLTNGEGDRFIAGARELFLAVAYYRVVGDNVPTWFTNTDDTYRTDILLEVWSDYSDWLDQFMDRTFQ